MYVAHAPAIQPAKVVTLSVHEWGDDEYINMIIQKVVHIVYKCL